MDTKKLKELIKFMEDNNLNELEVEEEGKRIRLRKNSPDQPVVISQGPAAPKEAAAKSPEEKKTSSEIKSPMVGTFYAAPSPGAKPYTAIGDIIKSGDVVCIIEAMKLMNEIKAEVGGKVVQILVENGEAVEFGQTLFTIEPV